MMKRFTFLLLILLSHHSYGCEYLMVVGVNQDWPPYTYKNGDQYSGLDIDITQLILTEASFCIDYRHISSSSRAFVELQKGKIGMLKAASYTEDRAKLVVYSRPYRKEKMILYGRRQNPLETQGLNELFEGQRTFVVNRGAHYGSAFSRLQKTYPAQVKLVNTALQRFGMLEKGRVSFTIDDELTGRHYIKSTGLTNIVATELTVHDNPVHFIFHRDAINEEQLQVINKSIINNTDKIQALYNQYATPVRQGLVE